AALFAFKSPLSKGALLADEVGLGKTIEAGILLSQKWAERKRKLLIIVPSSLRKQWNQELWEKFFLPSTILETRSFNSSLKQGMENPFQRNDELVICSYQFARNKSEYASQIKWDLIVIDEAHRLRNVYKPTNKIARALRETFKDAPKVLLTATPLQNSLMELYGLSSFIDEYAFGDKESFKSQYSSRIGSDETLYSELKSRLALICQRTLRRQVKEYVRYTKRISLTEEFTPKKEEQVLYEKISGYLQRENLKALPSSQRQLITLVLRKLLASSTFAIHGALTKMINRLESVLEKDIERQKKSETEISEDFESFEDTKEEWKNEDEDKTLLSESDKTSIKKEIAELKEFHELAVSITENTKGDSLLKALKVGFKTARELGAKEKVIIFTESRRTQNYLLDLLGKTQYAEKIVLFNGSNNDPQSKGIYKKWKIENKDSDRITSSKTADMRSALVDYFKNTAQIMIATEAAAEGINLQFCSFIINYDLPWNPQRIEQRIGRCHRYGQKHDVVVVNFLNKKNEADQRVLQLLSEKFRLFEGIFGASDEVLGSIESGVDFEKRILNIYQKCRTSEEIKEAFDDLQEDMSQPIDEKMKNTRQKLLENFDEEVHEKLKVKNQESKEYLDKYGTRLWEITKLVLKDNAVFEPKVYTFYLKTKPFGLNSIPLGPYRMGNNIQDSHIYRPNHPLAEKIVNTVFEKKTERKKLKFNYTDSSAPKISILENFIGKTGFLKLTKISIESFETEDYLIFSALTEEGEELDQEQCSRLFSLPAEVSELTKKINFEPLDNSYNKKKKEILSHISEKNSKNFETEMDKLDYWAEDRKKTLEQKLKEMDKSIRELKRSARRANSLPEKIKLQKQANDMENKRDKEWKEYEVAKKEIENKKEQLIDDIEARLKQNITENIVFEIEWEII
ncbi:MAG: SNF2-related protein, partial [Bdellovibrionales bacterium]|nr:SNF2-related protein [Bdellovibrionales bacterium]